MTRIPKIRVALPVDVATVWFGEKCDGIRPRRTFRLTTLQLTGLRAAIATDSLPGSNKREGNSVRRNADVVIHVKTAGNLGNQMLQYMAALKLSDYIPNSVVSGIHMDEWGIVRPAVTQTTPKTLRYFSQLTERLDFPDIASRVARRGYNRVELEIFSSHVDNLPSVETARTLFPLKNEANGYDEKTLVINVRGAEILQAVHPEYTIIPCSFYQELTIKTGLTPVFLGQLERESEYVKHLMASFPSAQFVASKGAHHDFSVLAKSKNIVTAVSTFSWLAAWLSHAERIIMPLSGFCNPLQYPRVDFMPQNDRRFEYVLFAKNYAVPDAQILQMHEKLSGLWRYVTYDEVQKIRPNQPAFLAPDTLFRRVGRKAESLFRRYGRR